MTTNARLLLAVIAAIFAASWASHSQAISLQPSAAEAITAPSGAANTAAPAATPRLAAVLGGGTMRDLAAGAAPLVHHVQGTITVTPDNVATGGSATVTLNASGF